MRRLYVKAFCVANCLNEALVYMEVEYGIPNLNCKPIALVR